MAEQWRILVIEGEENLNWNVVNALQKDGYIVRGVTSGGEAIRLLWNEEYDVAICNQQMPDMDGLDLLQWMRNYSPDSRMIMLGAPDKGEARAQALEMGVAAYLENPLDLSALKAELRRMLHSTGFSASLDSFDLLDVVQIITMSRKSIALVISTGLEEQGILRFQNGELISAEYGILRGEEAFFALAAHKNGTVVQRPWNEQVEPNVTQPLSRLIFQALQYRAKYAETQQASSELEAVQSSSSTALPPLPTTVLPEALQDQEDDDRPFQFATEDQEIDDRPFQFVAEEAPAEKPRATTALEQLIRSTASSGSALEQLEVLRNTPQSSNGTAPAAREWWEPTGPFPAMQPSGRMHAITDGTQEAPLPSTPAPKTPAAQNSTPPRFGSQNSEPGGRQSGTQESTPPRLDQKNSAPGVRPGGTQESTLPSWLVEQPSGQHLAVQRGQTGHMVAAPKSWSSKMSAIPPAPPAPHQASPVTPVVPRQASPVTPYQVMPPPPHQASPATPVVPYQTDPAIPSRVSTPAPPTPPQVGPAMARGLPTWQQPGRTAMAPSEAGLRKTKPEEALYTGRQQAIRPGTNPAVERQESVSGPGQRVPSGPLRAVNPETLQSLAALKMASVTPSASAPVRVPGKGGEAQPMPPAREMEARDWPQPMRKPAGETGTPRVTTPLSHESRRNYPALAAALQTLGHSVPGFVASAVVNLDGTPIAQVTVDDLDISPLCAHVGQMLRGALQTLQQGHWEPYEHTIISSRTRHILLRLIYPMPDTFQVLITTRETPPAESLEALANVEAAIAAALR